MSQNELKPRTLSSGVAAGPGSGSGESPGNSGCNCSSSNMNRITSSQSWSHSHVGSSAHNGTELTIGHKASVRGDFDARASTGMADEVGVSQTPQSSSSSQTGATLKEHDLLGMSEVCSSMTTRLENSAVQSNCGYGVEVDLDLNLGCPQEASHKQHGDSLRIVEHGDAGVGRRLYGSGLDGDSLAVGMRSSTADLGPRLDEQQRQPSIARRNFTYSPSTNVEEGDRAAIDSDTLPRWHGGSGVERRMLSTEELRLQAGRSLEMSAHQDDIIDRKRSLGSLDGAFQEAMPGTGQQPGSSDGARRQFLGSRYQDRPWQSRAQDAKASSMTGRETHVGERGEVPDRQQNMDFVVESGETLGWARQQSQLESRYMADWGSNVAVSGIRSLKNPDYFVPASHKPWQAQRLMSPTQFGGQEVESGRNVHPGPLSDTVAVGFVGARVPFNLNSKSGIVAGTKRSFDTAVMVPDARNFPLTVGGNSMTTSNPGPSEADAKSKAEQQTPLNISWSGKTSPASWQALQGNGGSIAPFPYHQSGTGSKGPDAPTDVGVSGDPSRRPWDSHGKGAHEPVSLGPKVFKEVNSIGTAPPSSSPATEVTSPPPRAETKVQAVGWPPLSKSRQKAKPAPVVESVRKPNPPPSPPPQASSPASVASQPDKSRVKVYMDGFQIGRTVDLRAGTLYDYETLSVVLEDMFNSIMTRNDEDESVRPSHRGRFLHGSEFVLTYEDREGDLMLVGDVPWPLFIENVKRLRIMRGSEADGLGSRAAERNNRPRPIL